MDPITGTGNGLTPSANNSPFSQGVNSTLGKDDFLQLLVTKLQNQDPLNPMQDEDFVAQLAQFSSLEQMTNIADGIAKSNQWDYLQMQSINNVMAASLIGKNVEADFGGLYYDGKSSPEITFSLDKYADELTITIKDSSGNVVSTLTDKNLDPGKHTFEWDGRDLQSNMVDPGLYSVEISAVDGSGNSFTPSQKMTGIVEAVTYRDGSAYFMVNGMEIPFGDVRAIIDPDDTN